MQQDYYNDYYILERSHWWFKARLKILEHLFLKKVKTGNKKIKVLNAGIATGATTIMLENHAEVTSLEYDKTCCEFVKDKLNIDAINASLTDLPFEDNTFDAVCAFDVIEHIDDDEKSLSEIRRVLKPSGKIFITVPAFMFLWNEHDDINHHFRRYTKKELLSKTKNALLKNDYSSYFNFFLFLPIAFIRIITKPFYNKDKEGEKTSDFEKYKGNGFINKFFYHLFKLEKSLLGGKLSLPLGVSLLYIGTKK